MSDRDRPDQGGDTPASGPPPRFGQDRIVGIVILVVGAILFWETFNFRTVAWDPLGLPFWPRIVLGIMGAIAVYLIVRNTLDAGPYQPLEGRPFVLLVGLTVYVALLPELGWLIATPLMLFCFHVALGGTRPARLAEAAVFAMIGTAIVFWVFQSWLYVQFPEGLLEPPL